MRTRNSLIAGVALVAAALVWIAVRNMRPAESPEPQAPDGEHVTLRFYKNPAAVPSFTARDLDGQPISSDTWRGKVTIVNFWATWCGPCRAEIPDLVALQEKYGDRLQVVGISLDEGSPELVKQFAAEHHVNYPIVMSTPELARIFPGVSALPTSFVLDTEFRLVQKHVGMLNPTTTELETRALAGLPVNASIEQVDRTQGLKLENAAQALDIPGIDIGKLPVDKRAAVLQKLNDASCTCGCDLTVAKCRIDDPACAISLPLAREIVQQIVGTQ